jgi:transcriptional regulator with XRE-family HTH domain
LSLGERLRRIRLKRKLTQAEAAKQVGVSRSALNMYERDERDPDSTTISALARFYGVSTDWLLGQTDDPTPALPARSQSPEEQLHRLGVWLRGVGATEEDVAFVKEYLAYKRRLREEER